MTSAAPSQVLNGIESKYVTLVDTAGNPLSSGGGPVTIADGADVTLGAKADAAAGSGTVSAMALLKWLADLVKLEDAAHADGDKGIPTLTRRIDAAASSAGTSGDYATFNTDATGRLWVNSELPDAAVLADGTALPTVPLVGTIPHLSNGTTVDLQRGNVQGTALASAARTATTTSADIVNFNGRGILITLDVTAASGTGGLQVTVRAKDPVTGNYVQQNTAPTAVVATGTTGIIIAIGATGSGALAQVTGQPIPRTFQVRVIHGDASSYTYSVGYCILN